MKIGSTVKKFQFFDEIKDPENQETFLPFMYSLKSIDPFQMEVKNKILLISGKVKSKNHKEDLELKSCLFKLINNKVIEEYKLFTKQICRFKLCSIQEKCYLSAIGYDYPTDPKKANMPVSLLKIYDFSECLNTNIAGPPILLKELNISEANVVATSKDSNKINCFAINDTLTYAAICFRDGRVHLITAKNNLYDSSSKSFKLLSGEIEKEKGNITNMCFGIVQNQQIIFITTITQIYYYKLYEKEETEYVIPEPGIFPYCFDICEAKNYFTVVTEAKIAFYVNLDQGPSWFFEGKKKCCYCFKDYIIFVSYEDKVSTLQIFDPNNKFFAFYQNSFDQILNIAIDEEFIYILYENEEGNDKFIKVLHEKENKEKFDTFYKKSFYDTAYEYAKNLNYDDKTLSEISKRYAQFLYGKGDYRKAIEQYINTINYFDPAYVIQPFIDASKLEYLIDYLEALHKDKNMKKNCPHDEMKDYSALLLNCYIKKKQLNKLKEFVEEKNDDEQVIDVNTAIEVCKESNQADIALSIADKGQIIDSSIQILIDIKKDYEGALKTLNKEKDILNKYNMLFKYGEKLIEKIPIETIEYIQAFIKEIIDIKNNEDQEKKKQIASIQYDSLIQIFIQHENELEKILDFIMSNDRNCPASVIHRRIEIYTEQKNIQKIKEMLHNKEYNDKLDINYLLMLFATQNIKNEVIADISEKVELKQDLIIQYMEKRNYPKIIECCQKYGKEDVNVWIQALTYFINYYNSDKSTVEYISIILKHIIENEAVSPLVILGIIKKLKYCGFYIMKDIITEYISKLQKSQIEDKKHLNDNYKKIEKLNSDIKDLNRKSKLFNMIKCSFCNQQLYMPITYFFCGHGFHPHCLNMELRDDMRKECPACFKSIIIIILMY